MESQSMEWVLRYVNGSSNIIEGEAEGRYHGAWISRKVDG
jgi:hypothetical protein